MAIQSGFFNSVAGDRKYDAEDINKFFDGVITDGVFSAIGDTLLVVPSSGLQVAIGSGKAWFLKSWIENTADAFLTLSDADVTYGRIDIIALDFDKSDQVRENDIIIVEGTPAATPVPPTLIDTATHLQKPLAHIQVDANETVIQASDITSKVDTVDCPFCTGIVDLLVEVDNVTIQIVANELSVKDDGITATKIAANAVGASEIAPDAVGNSELAPDAVSGGNIVDNAIDSEHYADLSIDTGHIANGAIIAGKIANDAVNSQHYAAGSIDNEHMAPNSINSVQYVDGSIDRAHLAVDIIDGTKIADNAINSEHYVDGSIDRAHLAADIIDGTKIADDAINSEHYAAGSIDNEHIADNAINSEHYAAGSIDNEHMAPNSINSVQYVDGSIDRIHLEADIIDSTKLANDSVNSEHYVDGSIDTAHIANDAVDNSKVGNRVMQIYDRQGGSSTNWAVKGNTGFTPTVVKMQVGVKDIGSVTGSTMSGTIRTYYPSSFPYTPVLQITLLAGTSYGFIRRIAITNTYFEIQVWNQGVTDTFEIHWNAVGQQT
jgi:hypothetical protein